MFHGRKAELDTLTDLYKKDGFQMPVIYGRRRVGKTRLIEEFCKDKRAIFYVGIEQNDVLALKAFSQVVLDKLPSQDLQFADAFTSWSMAFKYIAAHAKNERLILAIDEYPYLVNGNKSLSSILQNAIDHDFKGTQLFLILCGSSMSFMENQLANYRSPLYGRRTAQIKLRPLDYYDSVKFFSHWAPQDRLYGYGVAGGIPQYLLMLSQQTNIRNAIKENLLKNTGALFEEPINLMKQEMREPATYNSIIQAIAEGATKQNEIASAIGEETKKTANYLRSLLDLEIIRKEYPIGDKNVRRVVYRLEDNLFRFWYRFIPDALPLIEMNLSNEAYDRLVSPFMSDYFGHIFEDISKQYLLRLNRINRLPALYFEFGRWWGANPDTRQEEEIDIVGAARQDALFAESKWKNSRVGLDIFKALVMKSRLTQKGKTPAYYIFSKSGFSDALQNLGRQDLHLVKAAELLEKSLDD